MSNIEEISQFEVQKALDVSDIDFAVALKFLEDADCLHPSGTAFIGRKNLACLQNFVNRINQQRIVLSGDAERLLKFIANNPNTITNGDAIMTHLQWDEKRYMDAYHILKVKDFIDARYASNKPYSIWATNKGKETVIDDFRFTPQSSSNTFISNFTGSNNIVNVGTTLTSVNQSIQANSYITDPDKKELETLLKQLSEALESVPVESGEDAETVAETAQTFVENATKEKPNKSLVKISAEGLKKAAKNIAAIAPKVLQSAQAIIVFIEGLHSLHR